MQLYQDIIDKKAKVAVIGLGYVGLPIALAFAKKISVIGFDINEKRVEMMRNKIDPSNELPSSEFNNSDIYFTAKVEELKDAQFFIVAVPTPIDEHNLPDLKPLIGASKTVAQVLKKGDYVVYESTVYPGCTEDDCVPVLEDISGLKFVQDFKVGYSPERVNPSDKKHSLSKIVKVVSGQDDETAKFLAAIYGSIIEAGIHIAPNICTAEAAKVIENIQRDLNIALMNELAIIFNKLNIDTTEVFQAAATKWNFLKFEPGLVGGHCIAVDPYYLTYKAEEIGYHPDVILSGRRINDQMGKYIAEQTVKHLIRACKTVKKRKVLILGITFKENIKDIRNTRTVDIYYELKDYGVNPYIFDPLALKDEVKNEYNIDLVSDLKDFSPYDAIILAVKHEKFLKYKISFLRAFTGKNPVLIDVKSVYNKKEAEKAGFLYWGL